MALNKSSFGDAASKGLRETYMNGKTPTVPNSIDKNTTEIKIPDPTEENEAETISVEADDISLHGINPYYDYHPKTGQKGGTLGRPRTKTKRTQISIGCTEEEKELYKRAATSDGRKLPDFVNRAILEYIENHKLDV